MIGAGEVRNIFSEELLESEPCDSSVNEAVGTTGPGAVSNGLSHASGHEVGVPLMLKHCVIILRVRWIDVAVTSIEGVGIDVTVQSDAVQDVDLRVELELEQLIVLPASSKQSAMVVEVVKEDEVVLLGAAVGVSVMFDGQET